MKKSINCKDTTKGLKCGIISFVFVLDEINLTLLGKKVKKWKDNILPITFLTSDCRAEVHVEGDSCARIELFSCHHVIFYDL